MTNTEKLKVVKMVVEGSLNNSGISSDQSKVIANQIVAEIDIKKISS